MDSYSKLGMSVVEKDIWGVWIQTTHTGAYSLVSNDGYLHHKVDKPSGQYVSIISNDTLDMDDLFVAPAEVELSKDEVMKIIVQISQQGNWGNLSGYEWIILDQQEMEDRYQLSFDDMLDIHEQNLAQRKPLNVPFEMWRSSNSLEFKIWERKIKPDEMTIHQWIDELGHPQSLYHSVQIQKMIGYFGVYLSIRSIEQHSAKISIVGKQSKMGLCKGIRLDSAILLNPNPDEISDDKPDSKYAVPKQLAKKVALTFATESRLPDGLSWEETRDNDDFIAKLVQGAPDTSS